MRKPFLRLIAAAGAVIAAAAVFFAVYFGDCKADAVMVFSHPQSAMGLTPDGTRAELGAFLAAAPSAAGLGEKLTVIPDDSGFALKLTLDGVKDARGRLGRICEELSASFAERYSPAPPKALPADGPLAAALRLRELSGFLDGLPAETDVSAELREQTAELLTRAELACPDASTLAAARLKARADALNEAAALDAERAGLYLREADGLGRVSGGAGQAFEPVTEAELADLEERILSAAEEAAAVRPEIRLGGRPLRKAFLAAFAAAAFEALLCLAALKRSLVKKYAGALALVMTLTCLSGAAGWLYARSRCTVTASAGLEFADEAEAEAAKAELSAAAAAEIGSFAPKGTVLEVLPLLTEEEQKLQEAALLKGETLPSAECRFEARLTSKMPESAAVSALTRITEAYIASACAEEREAPAPLPQEAEGGVKAARLADYASVMRARFARLAEENPDFRSASLGLSLADMEGRYALLDEKAADAALAAEKPSLGEAERVAAVISGIDKTLLSLEKQAPDAASALKKGELLASRKLWLGLKCADGDGSGLEAAAELAADLHASAETVLGELVAQKAALTVTRLGGVTVVKNREPLLYGVLAAGLGLFISLALIFLRRLFSAGSAERETISKKFENTY